MRKFVTRRQQQRHPPAEAFIGPVVSSDRLWKIESLPVEADFNVNGLTLKFEIDFSLDAWGETMLLIFKQQVQRQLKQKIMEGVVVDSFIPKMLFVLDVTVETWTMRCDLNRFSGLCKRLQIGSGSGEKIKVQIHNSDVNMMNFKQSDSYLISCLEINQLSHYQEGTLACIDQLLMSW